MKTPRRPPTDPSPSVIPSSGDVFADLGFDAETAAELSVKAKLTLQIARRIRALRLTQTQAADRLNLKQPDVSKLMNGRYAGFSVDRLLSLLSALHVDVEIVVRPMRRPRLASRGTVRVVSGT